MSFLDDDPEDGFDVTDPPHERVRNIIRRLAYVITLIDDPDVERRIRGVNVDLDRVRQEIIDG